MNIFIEEHQKIVAAMLAEGVEFILVGGYAVNYHGYNRTTGDLDAWVKPSNKNKQKLLSALQYFNFDKEEIVVAFGKKRSEERRIYLQHTGVYATAPPHGCK